MATWQYELVDPPAEPRVRELWLQHAAGFIVFEDVRRYALERIDQALSDEARLAVQKGIDDAIYGLMMVIDGVTGGISNASYNVFIDFVVRLTARGETNAGLAISQLNLQNADGMCMGYHAWLEGDFGKNPVAARRSGREA